MTKAGLLRAILRRPGLVPMNYQRAWAAIKS